MPRYSTWSRRGGHFPPTIDDSQSRTTSQAVAVEPFCAHILSVQNFFNSNLTVILTPAARSPAMGVIMEQRDFIHRAEKNSNNYSTSDKVCVHCVSPQSQQKGRNGCRYSQRLSKLSTVAKKSIM